MHSSTSVALATDRWFNSAWPFTIPLVGLPVWWLLGIWQLMLLAMAIPMGIYLIRQRSIAVPRGFGLWLLWMAWLITGILVLQVDAPSAVPGFNPNRYISFAYRYSWYVAATIGCLYVINTRHIMSSQTVVRAVAWLFVWCSAGGILGIFAPAIDFPSVLQALLPNSVANNSFVNSLTRVRVAQVQEVIGAPLPRPSAPFFYTNVWGFATAISLPFFVAAWWVRGWKWRIAMVAVLAAGLFAIISSLNRGVWVAVLAAAGLAIVQTALQGRFKAIVVTTIAIVSVVVLLLFSPLSGVVAGRLDNGDSDEVRGNLAITAVESTAEGSPIVGFGSTRDVAGTFSSIAGGATDVCPRCMTPPLGTHGQLWLLIFGAGFVGVSLYVGFIASQLIRTFKVRSPSAMAASSSLLLLMVTLPFYDSVGIPIYLGLVGVGLLARESRLPLQSLQRMVRPVTRHLPLLGMVVLLGGVAGQGANMVAGNEFAATQRVLVPAAELVPIPGARMSTLDSEAELVRSQPVTNAVADKLGIPQEAVKGALRVGAEPNSRVLVITFKAGSAETARLGAETVVDTFIQERDNLLGNSLGLVQDRYIERQTALDDLQRSLREAIIATPSERLQTVLAEVEAEWTSVSSVLAVDGNTTSARAISGATVVNSASRRVVRVSSGLALGLLVGILLTRPYDQYYVGIRNRRMHRGPDGDTIVSTIPADGVREAVSTVRNYTPVAGVLAGSDSDSTLAMASQLDRLLPKGSHAGTRTLLIVDEQSRAGQVRQLHEEMIMSGMNPIGLVFRELGHSPKTRKAAAHLEDSRESG